MREEAEKRIGYLYPKAELADGSEATVIAWLWARTVRSSDPAANGRLSWRRPRVSFGERIALTLTQCLPWPLLGNAKRPELLERAKGFEPSTPTVAGRDLPIAGVLAAFGIFLPVIGPTSPQPSRLVAPGFEQGEASYALWELGQTLGHHQPDL